METMPALMLFIVMECPPLIGRLIFQLLLAVISYPSVEDNLVAAAVYVGNPLLPLEDSVVAAAAAAAVTVNASLLELPTLFA